MKKIGALILFIVLLGGFSGYLLWQKYKRRIVKDLIGNSVIDLTDSLYSLSYGRSIVDEINGDAFFEHIVIKADSSQIRSLTLAGSLPDLLVGITIKSITAKGLDLAKALEQQKLAAKEIIVNEPRITIIHTGKRAFVKEDSIALVRMILGNFNSIYAQRIKIINAQFEIRNTDKSINTQLTTCNITLNDIIIDSTKDYQNVVCYFINNMKASSEKLYINQPSKNSAVIFERIQYDSHEKKILIDKISSSGEGKNEKRFVLHSIVLEDLDVMDFVHGQTINVGNISAGECMLTLFVNKIQSGKANSVRSKNFDFPDDYFDKIKIGGISIGKSILIFKSKADPQKPATRIDGFVFHLSKNIKIDERNTLRAILDSAKWDMLADNFTLQTKDRKYEMTFKELKVDQRSSSASIGSLHVKPLVSKDNGGKGVVYQQDVYNIAMKSIQLSGLNINKLINDASVDIREVSLQLNIDVYHDRIPAERPDKEALKFPHQLLLNLDFPFTIQKTIIKNSVVAYRERSKETKRIGLVNFTNIHGIISNMTNNPLLIRQHPVCELTGSGRLFGSATCSMECRLNLKSQQGEFQIKGQIGKIKFSEFNNLTKPLALTTADGMLNSLRFTMSGNDRRANGDVEMLYSRLTLTSYKLSGDSLLFKDKKSKTMLSNLFVKNNNPSNGHTRLSTFSVQRDTKKSFFNLIWKGVNDGIQGTILNSKVAAIKKQVKKNR